MSERGAVLLGMILMIVITLILAFTIAAFVFGMSGNIGVAP